MKPILGLIASVLLLAIPSHAITKKKFDFVVGVDGDFRAAMTAAASKASATNRFYMFFPDGQYNIGSLTGDANQKTSFPTSYVSFIGQSTANTVVYNKSINEGISISATLYFNNAHNLYLQDLTVLNKANYGDPATYSVTGRHVVIQEQGNKIIYKNVKLLSTQDTYYTKGTRTYWENGEIHGTTDFICGNGDVFFESCRLYVLKKSAITAASTSTSWGYVFNNTTIDGDASDYTLGRSWGDAKTVFLRTKMNKLAIATGWGDPMNSVPKVFAEYKSVNSSGGLIDLSKRRTSYTKGTTTVTLNPVLTDAQAATYTVSNVLSGTDNWQPQTQTVQTAAPVIRQEGNSLKWSDDTNVLCWAIFKNGIYVTNVIVPTYDMSSFATGSVVTVRAANAMGGLGPKSNSLTLGAVVSSSSVPVSSSSVGPSSSSVLASSSNSLAVDNQYIYQAELGVMTNAVEENKNAGFSGSGYVNFTAVAGASIQFTVNAEAAGSTTVKITYSNGSTDVRQLVLSVNGATIGNAVNFPLTSAWTEWSTVEVNLPLVLGANLITLANVGTSDGPNVDKIELLQTTTGILPYLNFHPGSKVLRIYDSKGTLVMERNMEPNSDLSHTGLPPGVYIYRYGTQTTNKVGLLNIR